MDLRAFLHEISATYDRAADLRHPAQKMLKAAPSHLAEHVPSGMFIVGSGGHGEPTLTPWIGWFDPDVTMSPRRGIYVAYLFTEDLKSVALSLQQGMEELRDQHGDATARSLLARDADAIRSAIPTHVADWTDAFDLRSRGARQRAYQAGNLACRMYETASLPDEESLRRDLAAMINLYQVAVQAKRRLLLSVPGSVVSPDRSWGPPIVDDLANFRPKDAADYVAVMTERSIVKSRRHESLVNSFAAHASTHGFSVSSPHPQDLVLARGGMEILVEAKVIYQGNATDAVRATVGQLLTYSHFLHTADKRPKLLALFTEPVGDAYVHFLLTVDIDTIWASGGHWYGTPAVVYSGLAAPPP